MLERDPLLSVMATVDKRRDIVSKWNSTHTEPMDEDAVTLFLCDDRQGNLTDEQRSFAKERRAEMECCDQLTVYRLLQCGEMMRQRLVSGPEEYCRIFLPQHDTPCGKRIPPCNGL